MKATCSVLGSLNADLIGKVPRLPGPDEAVPVRGFRLAPGGHGGNCAIALARLGVLTRLVAAVGADPLGELLRGHLAREGVSHSLVATDARRATGVVFVPVLEDGDRALFMVPGPAPVLTAEVLDDVAGCRVVVLMDASPTVITEVAAARPRRLVFAPGGLVGELPPGALEAAMAAASHLVVNAPESRLLAGTDPPAAASLLAGRWGLTAVVTVGRDGCWVAVDGTAATRVPAFPATVVDTTGAGDAFVAGLAASLAGGAGEVGDARLACAVAALATRALGATAAAPYRDEVLALLATPATGEAGR